MKGSCTIAQKSYPKIRYHSRKQHLIGAGWRSRGWEQTEGKGMRSGWMFIWGLGLGTSLSPRVSLSLPGPRRTTAHVALCALQPHLCSPSFHNRHKAAFPLTGGPRRRDSFWESLECPLFPGCNQNLFCRNHLSLKPSPLLQKWSVYGFFLNIFHWKVTNPGVFSWYFHLSSHLIRGLGKSRTLPALFGEQAARDHLSSPCGHLAREWGKTGTKPARGREHMAQSEGGTGVTVTW